MQQGMLFHALSEPHSGVDIEQLVITLPEAVDVPRLQAAWERVVGRHAILRTAFRWDGAEPMQGAAEKMDVKIAEEAFPGEAEFSNWLHEDRLRGFAMDEAPLMRLRLFRGGAEDFRLVWTFHHALLDGRSFPIVLDEVFAFYDDPARPEPAASRPFRDFIDWHRAQDSATSEPFWRKLLAGFSAPTPLTVADLPGCKLGRAQGDAEVALGTAATTALRDFASSTGVTLNTLVQAAWALVLSRYSGEEDVCFGATRAGRKSTIDGAENIVGLLINTVPVRTTVTPDAPLAPWLRSLRENWIAIRPHEHTPLARIQAWSEVPHGTPLFKSLVVFENYDLTTHFRSRGGAWARRSLRLHEQTNFPLCIAAYAGAELRIVAEFDRARFDDPTITRLLGHLRTVLENFPLNPATIGAIPMLAAAEHEELLTPASPAPAFTTPAETLHALFAAQAARTPDAIALTQGDVRITYAELNRRAGCIAAHLASLGARAETIVGICMERTPDLVAAILGILKANAAYLPIDLAYPAERLAFMLDDAKAPILLTQRSLADRLPASPAARTVFIEDIDLASAASVPGEGTPGSLCYVIYTSGSTGKPKGCCITHRNVVRLFSATQHWFHFDERDVWTLFHSTAFDFSVWEIWGALLHGGRLVVVPFEISRSPESFHDLLIRERVTVLNQTPSAFRQLITADSASKNPGPLSLRLVIFGGEALEMQSLQPWFARHGDTRPLLVNMYGITETTVHVTYRPLTAADTQGGSVIGEAIPDLRLHILDPQGRPVPIGVPGELHVGGDGLARGYLDRPDLTAQRFIASPFTKGERLYRTGDLARWLPGRDIEYLGRIDHQVKIRGFRIELGEIEAVLARHPQVAAAAVLARDDGADGKRLVAWFVARPGFTPDTAGLRSHLKQFVPDYMVPAAFVQIGKMPLTNNGKLDTKALPAPSEERPGLASVFTAPRNAAEEKIAAVWRRVLKLERIGVDDNFFELGGDSILSILVVAQCRKAGITLAPKQIFDHPTIAGLAGQTGPSAPALPERELAGDVPLTPIQRWFFDHDFVDAHHWNQSFVFQLAPGIDDARLAAAFAVVFAAHPAFALGFKKTESGWTQFVREPGAPNDGDSLRRDTAVQSSFKLDAPLLHYARSGNLLTIAVHHLVIDGVSWRILLSDLDAALRAAPVAGPTTGFHTWAHALHDAANSPALSDELAHWSGVCTPAGPRLPVDIAGGDNLESSAATFTFTFGETETAALLRNLPAQNSKIQDALLAALARSLAAWTGAPNFTVEIEGHGREDGVFTALTGFAADLSHTIGWFTTIFPVTLRAGGDAAEALTLAAKMMADVPRNGFAYPLLRHLSTSANLPRIEPQVLFNFLGHFDHIASGLDTMSLAAESTEAWHAPAAQRTHVLEINSLIIHGRLEVRWTFSRKLHRPETIERAANVFAETLRELIGRAAHGKFALARCDTAPLLDRHPNASDIYPLSPMQRLFLTLEAARPGSGTDQWHARLAGPLDMSRLQSAWRAAIRRHTALRTAYTADEVPHAVVLDDAEPGWHIEDWREFSGDEQDRRFASFLAADAARPFDLGTPPLTRLALFRIAENEHRFVWTHHHLEIDGWSWPVLFRDIAALYAGGSPPPARPYRDYIGWLASRPAGRDEAFWRDYLRGLTTPTPLPLPPESHAPATAVEVTVHAPFPGDIAKRLKVTPNAIVQAAWALLLAHHSGLHDVVFGAALSGRPADLADSGEIVGHFVNNLPVRVRTDPSGSFAELAQRLHRDLTGITECQHAALSDVQAWSDLPWNARLFQTLLVFQNYAVGDSAMRLGDVAITGLHAPVRTNYPLTLVVTPDDGLHLALIALPRTASRGEATALLEQLTLILAAISENPGHSAGELIAALPPAFNATTHHGAPAPGAPREAPVGGIEQVVADVWREAFGRDVGVTDNFFDIGGHSLLMLQVHARLTGRLGREIPVVKLFQHPNIRSFARFLSGDAQPSAATTGAKERAARAKAALARHPLKPRSK